MTQPVDLAALGAQYREAKQAVPAHRRRMAIVELEQAHYLRTLRGVPSHELYDRRTGEPRDARLVEFDHLLKTAQADVDWCGAVEVACGEAYKGETLAEIAARNEANRAAFMARAARLRSVLDMEAAYADLNTIQTFNAGDILTAAAMQQNRDNHEFFIDPPACSVFNSTTQNVATSTEGTLTANSESFDNDSMHSTASSTEDITAQTAGRYLAFTTVNFAADADGSRRLFFRQNGATAFECFNIPAGSSVSTVRITGIRAITLADGDTVSTHIIHTAGNSLAITLEEFGLLFLTR